MRFDLSKRPSCQTLSNALDKYRKTSLTSKDGFASNYFYKRLEFLK